MRHLIFTAPHVRDTLLADFAPAALPAVHLIYNTFDGAALSREKSPGAERRLGLLGFCPKLKNPRLAVEILEHLLQHDDDWRLVLAGRGPEHYAWLWNRPEERAYYEALEEYLAARNLAGFLLRDGWTPDLPGRYAQIGFILSTSDLEGSHQVVAEGMAAGCIPVVRRWPGATEMYQNSQLFDTAREAGDLILRNSAPADQARLSALSRQEARERFSLSVILPQLEQLLLGAQTGSTPVPAATGARVEAQTSAGSMARGSPTLAGSGFCPA